jgi:hypothetical protein
MSFRRFLGLGLLGVMLATPLLYSAPQAGGQRKGGKRKGGGRRRKEGARAQSRQGRRIAPYPAP